MKIKYNLLKEEKNTKARLGTLETNYGVCETPMFYASWYKGCSERSYGRPSKKL